MIVLNNLVNMYKQTLKPHIPLGILKWVWSLFRPKNNNKIKNSLHYFQNLSLHFKLKTVMSGSQFKMN